MEADPITELPEISLLRQYPGLFDVIATKKQIQNGEWIYVSSYKDGGTPIQIWKHIYAPDLLAEVFGSHINTFMNTDAGAFFYSAKYDKFILYSAGSYSETSEDPDRERVIYETAPIIRRLYGKEDT